MSITFVGYSTSGVPDVGVDADLNVWSRSYVLQLGRNRNVESRGRPKCWGPVPEVLRQGVLDTLAAKERGEYPLDFPGLFGYVECLASGMTPEEAVSSLLEARESDARQRLIDAAEQAIVAAFRGAIGEEKRERIASFLAQVVAATK